MNTLDYYNKNSEEYFNSTLNVDMTNTYKEFLKLVPEGGKILDLGCGSGRDSMNFMKLGYEVTAVDGSKELAKKASALLGKEVIASTFEELELKEKFHGIWACASLLHIKREDLKTVLNNLYNNLEDNGVFYMSFKYGEKEYVDDKNRYFNCFTDESIISFINENTKYNILGLYITEDKLGRVNEVKWLNLICNKKSV
ncbi:MAG: methyltransferase domain-containing protein [Clostridiales bacterium]|uniref:class I SAM-dependent methyltransferase n=1 Tax=Terrisporobacter sp. TaxID=1965305 RepID=UPI002A4FDE41|nr:methyltransferase domain-containing protein [Terrisporobacter sp.]MDD7755273.1 methyltransferase domain-containing protein [Clostridiales bacterium]MDY4135738.1 methyltransferase domain-containing protein [Terrisporobacter sp.]